MLHMKQGSPASAAGLSSQQVCDAEFVASWLKRPLKARRVSPSLGHKAGGFPAGSSPVTPGSGTRNKLVWLQLRFELEDMAGKP